MINKKEIIKILLTLVLLVGATAGVTLVKEKQDIREKAAGECNSGEICKKSCGAGETPTGKICSDILDGICCRPTSTSSCASIGGSCFDGGCPSGYTDLGRSSCPPDARCCKSTSSPTPTPPGGGGGGGTTAGCSNASAAACQGKNPGEQCKTGKKCKETSQKGGDGKPKCICESSGSGGGGGGGGTTCDFGNGGKNPTRIGPFKTGGEVTLFFAKFIDSAPPKIALKKNASTCSLTDSDKVLDTKNISKNGLLATGLTVASGDYLCLYLEDVAESGGPYPTEGWTTPNGNLCGTGKEDISSLTSAAQSSGNNLFSTQCWGDYAAKADCDFDDYALIVTVGKTTSTAGLTLLFRQQGIITSISSLSPEYLKTTVTFRQNGDDILQIKNTPAESVDENGVWHFKVPTDSITPGTYDILIKGISHLQKKFSAVPIAANQNQIDKSLDTKDELKAGDANNDNSITIEDISTVLAFYTDFKIPVDPQNLKMVYSDINKDGFITIDDVALTALNWSDFNIPGDK